MRHDAGTPDEVPTEPSYVPGTPDTELPAPEMHAGRCGLRRDHLSHPVGSAPPYRRPPYIPGVGGVVTHLDGDKGRGLVPGDASTHPTDRSGPPWVPPVYWPAPRSPRTAAPPKTQLDTH